MVNYIHAILTVESPAAKSLPLVCKDGELFIRTLLASWPTRAPSAKALRTQSQNRSLQQLAEQQEALSAALGSGDGTLLATIRRAVSGGGTGGGGAKRGGMVARCQLWVKDLATPTRLGCCSGLSLNRTPFSDPTRTWICDRPLQGTLSRRHRPYRFLRVGLRGRGNFPHALFLVVQHGLGPNQQQ